LLNLTSVQKLEALQKQTTHGLKVGEREEKSAFLTYFLSQTDLTPQEVNSNCVDLMLGAVETVNNYIPTLKTNQRLIVSLYYFSQDESLSLLFMQHVLFRI